MVKQKSAVLFALLIDAVGSGLWLPFNLIFFTRAQGQSLSAAGVAMSVGALLGLVVGQLSGAVIDRYGPGPLIVASNAVRVAGFLLYPFVHEPWQMALAVFVVFSADRVFWSANVPFIGTLVSGRQVDRFLGTSGTLQMIGLGVGAAVAGVFANSASSLHVLARVNAGSFAVAGLIVLTVVLRRAAPPASSSPSSPSKVDDERAGGSVWRDKGYLLLCATQVLFVLASSSFVIILPLVALEVFHGPAWLPGVSIVAGNVVLAALQKPILSLASKRSRSVMLILAVPCYAAAFLLLAGGRSTWGAAVAGIVLAAAVLGAVGEVVANALMLGAANDAAPEHLKGRYSALFQTSWGLAEVIAPTAFAMLLARGNATLWLTLAAVSLALIPMILTVRRNLPAQALLAAAEA